jgi:hypothetical protein
MAYVLCGALVAAAGCGRSRPNVPFGIVEGEVTLDGKPLAGAAVTFEPEIGRPSHGTTGESGEYSLMYRGNPWGAIVGRHTVRITTETLLEDSPDAAPRIAKERLPKRYHSQSTLSAEVVSGKNVIDFALTSD